MTEPPVCARSHLGDFGGTPEVLFSLGLLSAISTAGILWYNKNPTFSVGFFDDSFVAVD